MSALLENENGRPCQGGPVSSTAINDTSIIRRPSDILAELDARAEAMRGVFVVEVAIGEGGKFRRYIYRSTNAAEKCVLRARLRGAEARVVLCQLLPVGVVGGLGGGR